VQHEIDATGPSCVADAIAALGRTEDVRFSPDGRRVAITCFHDGASAVVDLDIEVGTARVDAAGVDEAEAAVRVEHTAITRLVVDGLTAPHGVDWLDDRTVIVADRAGRMGLVEVPPSRSGVAADVHADLLPFEGEFAAIYGPGSVTVVERDEHGAEVLVCNNWGNRLTRNRLRRGEPWVVTASEVCLERLLDLPDGVATSADGAWLAVSNHNRQVVVVYEGGAAPTGGPEDVDRLPVGVLRGTSYPHGLRFTRDGQELVVADAGSRDVHVYRRGEQGWSVAGYPSAALAVVTADEFAAGNSGPGEGGPKGVDLDPTERVLAVTCGEAPLRWFDLRAVRAAGPHEPAALVPLEIEGLERETALKVKLAEVELRLMETETREHEAQALASRTAERADDLERRADELSEWAHERIAAADAEAAAARERLRAIERSNLWRALAPLRRAATRIRTPGR
jgi:DNA-binding beta-propeller fold protein YncE